MNADLTIGAISFPRPRGDEPPAEKKIESGLGFSPPTRG